LVLAEGAEGDNRTAPGPQQQRLQREPGARPDDAPGLRQQQRGQRGVRPGYEGRYGEQQRMQRGPIPGANEQQQQYWAQTPGYEGRGADSNRNFHRGGRLPQEYRNRQYVVEDWRGHHLSAPPRGYQWVQAGGDYVLIAIATGIIAQILLSQ
jgi:Ni/Co efflux regulator RcnB